MNAAPFLQLDRVIHEKGRLAIMSALAASTELAFVDLRDVLAMTDGNVTAHVRSLQQAGYVAVTKQVRAGKPLTTFTITQEGKAAFQTYLGLLEEVLKEARKH